MPNAFLTVVEVPLFTVLLTIVLCLYLSHIKLTARLHAFLCQFPKKHLIQFYPPPGKFTSVNHLFSSVEFGHILFPNYVSLHPIFERSTCFFSFLSTWQYIPKRHFKNYYFMYLNYEDHSSFFLSFCCILKAS